MFFSQATPQKPAEPQSSTKPAETAAQTPSREGKNRRKRRRSSSGSETPSKDTTEAPVQTPSPSTEGQKQQKRRRSGSGDEDANVSEKLALQPSANEQVNLC